LLAYENIYDALSWTGLMGSGNFNSITGSGNFNSITGLYSDSTTAWINKPQVERLSIINTFNNTNSNCQ